VSQLAPRLKRVGDPIQSRLDTIEFTLGVVIPALQSFGGALNVLHQPAKNLSASLG
jgi:hypothetical protein